MLKQSSSKAKKVLALLLAVLFVVSLTAAVASARDGNEGRGHDGGGGHGSSITGTYSTRFGDSLGSVYGHSGCGWVNGAWVCST
jgi:hypothetical protein